MEGKNRIKIKRKIEINLLPVQIPTVYNFEKTNKLIFIKKKSR